MATSVLDRKYTWKPSPADIRDLHLDFGAVDEAALPDVVDLRLPINGATRPYLPPVVDQLNLGACTANMAAGAWAFSLALGYSVYDFAASRLFIYFNERVAEGTVSSDSGATITGSAKALADNGAPPEADWPYDISKFTEKPPAQAYTDGAERKAVKYARVAQTSAALRACLAAGAPICHGFTVYQSFESSDTAATGVVSMPATSESTLGGHATLIVGYIPGKLLAAYLQQQGKDASRVNTLSVYYIVRNSWGIRWGDAGHYYIPEAYLLSRLASDFWVIQTVDSPDPTPTPPAPVPPPPVPIPPKPSPDVSAFPGALAAVSIHIERAATRGRLAIPDWLNNHFVKYFNL